MTKAIKFAVTAVVLTGCLLSSGKAEAASLVISQIYGAGGNAGASFRNDFIELFNGGSTAVDLSNYSVQYAATTGTNWTVTALATLTVPNPVILPNQYYLIQQASGGSNGALLPTADRTAGITMSATAGKVALVNNTISLTGTSCPTGANIVDFVGYGTTTNCSEGSPTALLSATTAAIRLNNGFTDTNNNAADFITGTPSPRNSSIFATPVPAPIASPLGLLVLGVFRRLRSHKQQQQNAQSKTLTASVK